MSQACQNGQSLTVFLIDIDHFKSYNDHFGHVQGDAIIKLQAYLLRQVFDSGNEVLGRYGGEEFIAIALAMDEADAHNRATRLNKLWHDHAVDNPRAPVKHMTCSVGVYSEVPARGRQFESLIRAADLALYQAKHQGRDCYVYSQGPAVPVLEVAH